MNKTVMIICGTFIVCNLPGSIVLSVDPSAKIVPQVKENDNVKKVVIDYAIVNIYRYVYF